MAERVQVQGLGGAVPGISPTIQRGGQYAVQVQQAGRNKLMDLADALGQVNPLLQQYGQLQDTQYKLGLEQAALVEEKQEIEQLNNTKDVGFFDPLAMNARNRGVRDGLLKRYISNTMVPNLSAKTDELIDVQKYTEDEDFYAAVDNEIAKEWQGLVNQVGERIANTTASKALWNTVAPRYKAELIAKFEKAKQDFIESTQDEDSMSDLRFATRKIEGPMTVDKLQNLITNREELMKESGIIDPGTRQKILLNSYITQANTLLTNGRYKDAEAFIQSMIGAKVNNRKVFGSTESQVKINSVITKLEEARKEDNKLSDSKKQQLFAGYYDIASEGISGLQRDGKLEDSHITAIKTTIESLSPALRNNPKEVQSLVDQIASSTNPQAAYKNILSNIALDPESSDEAQLLWVANTTRINNIDEDLYVRPQNPLNFSADFKAKEEEEFRNWASSQNKQVSLTDWLRNKNYRPWDSLKAAGAEVYDKGAIFNTDQWKDTEADVTKMLRPKAEAVYGDALRSRRDRARFSVFIESETARGFGRSARDRIQQELKDKWSEVMNMPPEKRNKALTTEKNKLLEEEAVRWERIVNAHRDVYNMRPETQSESIDPQTGQLVREAPETVIKKTGGVIGEEIFYPSLRAVDIGTMDRVKQSVVERDRGQMMEREQTNEARRSYYNYGFFEYDPEAPVILKKLGLDSDDVKLFRDLDELESKVTEWETVMVKDINGESLSKEEVESLKQVNDLGMYRLDKTWNDFKLVQLDLLMRPNRF
jgi:hypothetical protein